MKFKFFLLLVTLGLLINVPAPAQDDNVMILNGREIHYTQHIAEEGKPTVILQSGARSHMGTWSVIVPLLAVEGYGVLAYDRPGLGISEVVEGERTGMDIAKELNLLLNRLNIDTELILVGHSMGGMYQAIYNDLYPDNVKGLIMIDSPNGTWEKRLRGCLSNRQNVERDSTLTAMRDQWSAMVVKEYQGAQASFDYMDSIQLKNPLTIISGGSQSWPLSYNRDCLSNAWTHVQQGLKKLRQGAKKQVSASSGHGIPQQDPWIVLKAIAAYR